ncbi:MAG TPA: DUF5131 family protein [Rhodothermales bacterium]|nr:DUF5131 family protein [Rhodothermales bacterium]
MALGSGIEWTEATWNPVTGCTRVSAGCDNCYAVSLTRRLDAIGLEKYRGLVNQGKGHFNGIVRTHEDLLDVPLSWPRSRLVFVNSMSDLLHPSVPDAQPCGAACSMSWIGKPLKRLPAAIGTAVRPIEIGG